jgi:hypothetical protein
MISPYYEFITEQLLLEAKLTYSNDFRDILINMKSPLADEILKLNNTEVDVNTNYINITSKDDIISFKPENSKNDKRSEIKIGRFAKRLLDKVGIETTDRDIELFVNDFKSNVKIIKGDAFEFFEILSGEEIKSAYDEDNYDLGEGGSLLGSCMRYKKCQKYFDIYTKNPNQVSLIVYKNDSDRIRARALLWTDIDGRKFMDRVYTINDSDVNLFIKFAEQNGYIYKEEQDSSEYTNILKDGVAVEGESREVDGNSIEPGIIVVELEYHGEFSYYPYLDTLKYYSPYDGKLSNSDSLDYTYKLEDTDGGNGSCESCGGSSTVNCGPCDGEGTIDCDDCDGRGEINCSECSGEGTFDCHECEGGGEEDCSTCDGSGKDPDNEKEECSDCDGRGKQDCSGCGGDGTFKCDECSGSGDKECTTCWGSGNYECGSCEGNGTVDCRECDS